MSAQLVILVESELTKEKCVCLLAKAPETGQLFIEFEHKEKYPRM